MAVLALARSAARPGRRAGLLPLAPRRWRRRAVGRTTADASEAAHFERTLAAVGDDFDPEVLDTIERLGLGRRAGCYNPKSSSLRRRHACDASLVAAMLAHELVHAYDQCRARVRWSDCRHHACSEVRASNLSGECDFANEVARGHFAITSQQRACVRRRAMLSVGFNPHCSAVAKAAVEHVFDACYHDTAPFDDIP